MFKILIAEDDDYIRELISKNLTSKGYRVLCAQNGKQALDIYEQEHVDLLITDILMPIMDGNSLVNNIRKQNNDIPILMLTALESFADKEKGFRNGTDDYMVKPIDMAELCLRIHALLRRYKIVCENKLELNSTLIDYSSHTVTVRGEKIDLTNKEFLLLFKLLSSANVIFTRAQLMNEIWGYDSESEDRTIDTHIKRIREKLNCDDFEIVTVRGLGYKAVIK